jgi:peptidyl-prolyl cis-trans isomerase A (cyclophilin A)
VERRAGGVVVPFVEALEDRTHFAAAPVRVVGIIADNRGEVQIRVNKILAAGTVNRKSFRCFIGGPDGSLGTADDVQVPAAVSYDAATKTMTLRCSVPADTNYRVKLYASGITDADGLHLDGEFSGTYPTGNSIAGGDLQFRTKRDSSNKPIARITTSDGLITVRLNKKAAPATVANFIAYANATRYDGSVFHRNSKSELHSQINVLQTGGLYSDFSSVPAFAPVALEAGLPNLAGSLAMARSDDHGDPAQTNTATSSFFINVTDNPKLNPNNGDPNWSQFGYAVFGSIISGMDVVQKVFALPTTNLGGATLNAPNDSGHYVILRRVTIQMKVATV